MSLYFVLHLIRILFLQVIVCIARFLKGPESFEKGTTSITALLRLKGLIKVDQEMVFSRSKPGIQLLISRFFIIRSAPGFQIWVSNLRFTLYFNASFNLFLSYFWLLVFGFLQDSAVKPRFWTFFSVNYCFFLLSASSDLEFSFANTGSDLELSFSNPGLFEFQV